MRIQNSFSVKYFALFALMFVFGANISAQTKSADKPTVKTDLPKITQVDEITVKELFAAKKENAKPLLVNFWATWCVPCREEFPDLVKIDEEFRGKIDFITITLDDPAEITRDVPQFLMEMKAKMPTYLLYTSKESEVIGGISKEWSGGLPFTVLYNEKREIVFTEQGIIKPPVLKAKINELIKVQALNDLENDLDEDTKLKIKIVRELKSSENPFQKGQIEAQKDLQQGKLQIIRYGEGNAKIAESDKFLNKKYGINFPNFGCKMTNQLVKYIQGYNEISTAEIETKFGKEILNTLWENAENQIQTSDQ